MMQLTKREKLLLRVLMLLVLFLLYYYVFWQPAAERITLLRNLQRTDMPMDAADFSSADISAPVAGLIPFTAPEEVLAVLYSLAALAKVDIIGMHIGAPGAMGMTKEFASQSAELALQGDFTNICDFLVRFEKNRDAWSLEHLHLFNQAMAGQTGAAWQLHMQLQFNLDVPGLSSSAADNKK